MTRSCLSLTLILSATLCAAQECGTGRYSTYDFFPNIDSTVNVPFGHNIGFDGSDQTLLMNVYEPTGDALQERPVVLVAFGGSFIVGSRSDVASFCTELAHLGYVAVAMDYRVGFFLPTESTTMHTVMRCVHDLRGCIRYLRKTAAEDGNPYRIDPERIIIGGVSSGAIGAVQVTYMDQPSELPAVLVADSASFGGMEGTSGPLGYSSDVMACYSLSGAIGDTSWIQPGDQSLCSIHETGDMVVPCFTEQVYAFGFPTGITVSGSHDIHERMSHIGVPDCYLEYTEDQHVGYLLYDPDASIDLVVQFLARVVCGEPPGCPAPLFGAVAETAIDADRLQIAPNPSSGSVTIHMPEAGTMIITDIEGREVMHAFRPSGNSVLDLSLGNGLYFVRTEGPLTRTTRIMVAH